MSVNQQEGDLIPLPDHVLHWVYGPVEMTKEVFGKEQIYRSDITHYYKQAEQEWPSISFESAEALRSDILRWVKGTGLHGLEYYFPMSRNRIWFKDQNNVLIFALKFGVIDKK